MLCITNTCFLIWNTTKSDSTDSTCFHSAPPTHTSHVSQLSDVFNIRGQKEGSLWAQGDKITGALGKARSHTAAPVWLWDSAPAWGEIPRADKRQASHINTLWAASNRVIILAGWNCVTLLFSVRCYASGIYFIYQGVAPKQIWCRGFLKGALSNSLWGTWKTVGMFWGRGRVNEWAKYSTCIFFSPEPLFASYH